MHSGQLVMGAGAEMGEMEAALLYASVSLVGTHPVIGELLNGGTESIISAAAFASTGHGLEAMLCSSLIVRGNVSLIITLLSTWIVGGALVWWLRTRYRVRSAAADAG